MTRVAAGMKKKQSQLLDDIGSTTPLVGFLDLFSEEVGSKTVADVYNYYAVPESINQFLPLCRIRSGTKFIPFVPYGYQVKTNEIISSHQNTLIIKDRQIGLTETLAGRLLHQCLLNPAFLAALVSINQTKATEISSRIKLMCSALKIRWERDASTKRKVLMGGEVQFLPSTDDAIRSLPSVVELVFEEAGFIKNFLEVYGTGTSAQEMVDPSERKTILNTTIPTEGRLSPVWGMFDSNNPVGNSATEMLKVARNGETNCDVPGMVWWESADGWAKIVISHKAHPIYGKNPNYLKEVQQRRQIPWSTVQREHNLGIDAVKGSLFEEEHIDRQAIGEWQEYIPGRLYLGCTDPNFGGEDESANYVTQIWDITERPYSLVAEYAECDRSTQHSEKESLLLFDTYRVALVAVESNSGGKIVAENYIDKRPNLRVEVTLTSAGSKRVNTDRVAFALEQGYFIYPSDWEGKGEYRSFSAIERKATGGEKDDRVMAQAAGWAWIEEVERPPEIDADSIVTVRTTNKKRKDPFGR